MITSNEEYLSNSLEYVYKPEVGQRIKYTANTGTVVATAANANLDGTGTLYTVLQSNLANGTLIKTITLKAQVSTTRGMVRLYTDDGTNLNIIAEVEVPACSATAIKTSFAICIEVDFMLKYLSYLKASIQNAEALTITAEGLDISFP